jgi:hypothetical protein
VSHLGRVSREDGTIHETGIRVEVWEYVDILCDECVSICVCDVVPCVFLQYRCSKVSQLDSRRSRGWILQLYHLWTHASRHPRYKVTHVTTFGHLRWRNRDHILGYLLILVCYHIVLYTIHCRVVTMSDSERDPLLPKENDITAKTAFFSPIRRVLFVALVSAASFAFTQTSLIYAFRVMTCDDYYDQPPHHLLHPYKAGYVDGAGLGNGGKDRCSIPIIEGRTARAIAIMSTMTTFCCTSSPPRLPTPVSYKSSLDSFSHLRKYRLS